MKDLRIVFMGTPEFAVTILKNLVEHNYNIVGVITAPDKPAGRGRKLNQSAIKEYATKQELNVFQPTNLKSDTFTAELKALNANLQIVVAFRMLPKSVWQMPEYGTFNLHASLLPQYRGAAPINWAIINGEEKTGVSTFFIDDKIDTGEMILQESVAIDEKENAGTLHDKLMHLGAKLVLETVNLIEKGEVNTQPQLENAHLKTAYKLNRDNCKINFEAPKETIYNLIRGLDPYPAAYCTLINGEETIEVKIHNVELIEEEHQHEPGQIISTKKEIKVAVNNGFLNVLSLKLSGKRKMTAKDLLNGYQFEENAKLL
jgi:methionyl-tRNA formyltransferase